MYASALHEIILTRLQTSTPFSLLLLHLGEKLVQNGHAVEPHLFHLVQTVARWDVHSVMLSQILNQPEGLIAPITRVRLIGPVGPGNVPHQVVSLRVGLRAELAFVRLFLSVSQHVARKVRFAGKLSRTNRARMASNFFMDFPDVFRKRRFSHYSFSTDVAHEGPLFLVYSHVVCLCARRCKPHRT